MQLLDKSNHWARLCQRVLTTTLFGVLALGGFAQGEVAPKDNRGGVLTLDFAVGGALPHADLADRFGPLGTFGVGADYLTPKDWFVGAEFAFLYNADVKENPLAELFNENGQLYGNNLQPARLAYRARGQYYGGRLGRLFQLGPDNTRSGIRVVLGAGLLQHKIRIQEDATAPVPQVVGDYAKGYDRLSNGLALQQHVGYQYLSANRRINFYLGLDFYEAFTRNRRAVDFSTRVPDTTERTDILTGVRAAWILPLYTGKQADEIYY